MSIFTPSIEHMHIPGRRLPKNHYLLGPLILKFSSYPHVRFKIVYRTRTCSSSLIFNCTNIRTHTKTKSVTPSAPKQTGEPNPQPHPHQLLKFFAIHDYTIPLKKSHHSSDFIFRKNSHSRTCFFQNHGVLLIFTS